MAGPGVACVAAPLAADRLWRDGGYALGAILSGALADQFGLVSAILAIAAITLVSGLITAICMYETLPSKTRKDKDLQSQ